MLTGTGYPSYSRSVLYLPYWDESCTQPYLQIVRPVLYTASLTAIGIHALQSLTYNLRDSYTTQPSLQLDRSLAQPNFEIVGNIHYSDLVTDWDSSTTQPYLQLLGPILCIV